MARFSLGLRLPAALSAPARSRRAITWLVIACAAAAAGWFLILDHTPRLASAANAPPAAKSLSKSASASSPSAKTGSTKSKDTPGSPPGNSPRPRGLPTTSPVASAPLGPMTPFGPIRTTPPELLKCKSPLHLGPPVPATLAPSPPAPPPVPRPPPPPEPLGPVYCDETSGFAIRFPTGWAIKTFATGATPREGDPWILDAFGGDAAGSGMISVGFTAIPANVTTEQILPEAIARRIRSRPNTTLQAQGYAKIDGRKALWSKSTGPLTMTTGKPMMTRVHYILPLGDGRALELRVAAPPEQFDHIVALMRMSIDTFKLLPRAGKPPG